MRLHQLSSIAFEHKSLLSEDVQRHRQQDVSGNKSTVNFHFACSRESHFWCERQTAGEDALCNCYCSSCWYKRVEWTCFSIEWGEQENIDPRAGKTLPASTGHGWKILLSIFMSISAPHQGHKIILFFIHVHKMLCNNFHSEKFNITWKDSIRSCVHHLMKT